MTNWFETIEDNQKKQKEKRDKQLGRNTLKNLVDIFLNTPMLPVVLYSGGKDSSATKSLSLVAWHKASKLKPHLKKIPFIIGYADTRCESPVKNDYLEKELDQAKSYAKEKGINLIVLKATPTVQNSWQGKVVAGSVVNWDVRLGVRGCAVEWKIKNLSKSLSPWYKTAKELGFPLIKILGSRAEESIARNRNLIKAGANPHHPVEYKGDILLHPIMDWSVENVWNYLMLSEREEDARFEGIKNGFENTMSYYNDMNGGECSAFVEGDDSCTGSRDGCWLCLVNDKPYLDDGLYETYPHLAPLGELRRFMLENNLDASNRSWIPQSPSSISDHKAASHSGAYLLDILRIGLTIQKREMERAERELTLVANGIHLNPENARTKAEFKIFTYQDIAWIDWNWMMRGLQVEPHAALKAYYEVYFLGERYDIPHGYKRSSNRAQKPESAGKILYSGLDFDEDDGFELTSDDTSWGILSSEELSQFFECKATIEKWLEEKSFVNSADKWFETGVLTAPKAQISRIKKRRKWVEHLYSSGMNRKAFEGGRFN